MSASETTATPASESSLHRLFLDVKSDFMQHVQDCVSNAMQSFVRDEVLSELSDGICDDHSNPCVSDETRRSLPCTQCLPTFRRDSGSSFWGPSRSCGEVLYKREDELVHR